jgi:hydroxymethylpyrimidine pyrophosphatase-like HAD family hydrolase
MVIAVDADGTLFDSPDWPEIKSVNVAMIDKLKRLKANGHRLILWTCREGVPLFDAVETMRGYGLKFDAVNDNVYECDRRKVVADVYVDDRSLSPDEFVQMPERMLRRLYGGNTSE